MSVFKVDSDFKVVVNSDAAKLVPELKLLSQDELIFSILAVDDVDGPFRKKPVDERLLMAKKRYPAVNPESTKMKQAMESYRGLIFDRRRKTIDTLNYRYNMIDREIETNMTMTASKLSENIRMQELIAKRIETLQQDIDSDEMAYELKGGKQMSFLEKWQINQKKYEEYKSEL